MNATSFVLGGVAALLAEHYLFSVAHLIASVVVYIEAHAGGIVRLATLALRTGVLTPMLIITAWVASVLAMAGIAWLLLQAQAGIERRVDAARARRKPTRAALAPRRS
jgi:hypothetical protein